MHHPFREIDIVHLITITKDAFFLKTTTGEIAQDIKQFCCGTNASVLGVDTTFNLCNMWIRVIIRKELSIQKQEITLCF